MNDEAFSKRVEQELISLDRRGLTYFAWRCTLRLLPFLSIKGKFDIWDQSVRQQYLYAVLYSLDAPVYSTEYDYDYAIRAATASEIIPHRNVADTVSGIAIAIPFAACADDHYAINRVINRAVNAINIFFNYKNMDLQSQILQDLKAIKAKEKPLPISTEWYGEIWNSFQTALKAEGCTYWGELYKGIFRDGIVLDQEALARRINVPKEIRSQGAAEVATYLQSMEKDGATRLNEARIIILGEKGAGKTCIARRLIDPKAKMTTGAESTAGVNTLLWTLKDENINVRIWDFAGHTVTHAVHQFFLSERSLYLIVCNGRTEGQNRLTYWLDQMKNYGGDSQAIILVNKLDPHSVDIPINSLKERYPTTIAGIYTFSIQEDSEKLLDFRNKVADFINNNPSWNKLEIPISYYQVKDKLETLFLEEGAEHICRKEFDKIAQKYEIENNDALLTSLHSLGISLWYGDIDNLDKLVLNPEWISHGVYKIINWVNEAKKYSLTLEGFVVVFNDEIERYPKGEHGFLFDLMKRYELAYETESKNELIIPHLLKEDRPKLLPDFPIGESLMLRYKADLPLPPHTTSRFIVRHHKQIEKKNSSYSVWRYGVVLQDGTGCCIALVREDYVTIR